MKTDYVFTSFFNIAPPVVTGMSQTNSMGSNLITLMGYNFGSIGSNIQEIWVGQQACTGYVIIILFMMHFFLS